MQFTIRRAGILDYATVQRTMQRFTAARDTGTPDELWFLQHPPVFTLGMGANPAHVLDAGVIPVRRSDRGGQVTYHGPGQLIAYVLIDLRRAGLGIKSLVRRLEQSVIDLLAELGVQGQRQPGAPGVYVGDAKIAALGLRVRRGCCYHGLALNVDMDTTPFARINPCGFPGLRAAQLRELGSALNCDGAATRLLPHLLRGFDARAAGARLALPELVAAYNVEHE
jgi:lipoyl(octanoyl) transferase